MSEQTIRKNPRIVDEFSIIVEEIQRAIPSLDDVEVMTLALRSLASLVRKGMARHLSPEFTPREIRTEVWKAIDGHPNCAISNLGRVRGVANDPTRIRRISQQTGGYAVVLLNGRQRQVSRLVGQYFIRPPREGEVINHINGNKLDNRAKNLEWTLQRDNIRHSNNCGLRMRPSQRVESLSADERVEICQFRRKLKKGLLGKIYGIKSSEVASVEHSVHDS